MKQGYIDPGYQPSQLRRPTLPYGLKIAGRLFSNPQDHVREYQQKYPTLDPKRIESIVKHVIQCQWANFIGQLMEHEGGWNLRDFDLTHELQAHSIIETLIKSDCTLEDVAVAMSFIGRHVQNLEPDAARAHIDRARHVVRNRAAEMGEINAAIQKIDFMQAEIRRPTLNASLNAAMEKVRDNLNLPMIQLLEPAFNKFVFGEISVGDCFTEMFGGTDIATDHLPDIICDVAAAIGTGALQSHLNREIEAGRRLPSNEELRALAIEAVAICFSQLVVNWILPSSPLGTASARDPRHVSITCINEFCRRSLSPDLRGRYMTQRQHFMTWCERVFDRGIARQSPPVSSSNNAAA